MINIDHLLWPKISSYAVDANFFRTWALHYVSWSILKKKTVKILKKKTEKRRTIQMWGVSGSHRPPQPVSTPPAWGPPGLTTDLLQLHHLSNNSSCPVYLPTFVCFYCIILLQNLLQKNLRNVPSLLPYFCEATAGSHTTEILNLKWPHNRIILTNFNHLM